MLDLNEIIEVSQRALSDYEHKGWTEEQDFIERARTWLPALVEELRETREALWLEKAAYRGAVVNSDTALYTVRQELEQARAETERLRQYVPMKYLEAKVNDKSR